MENEIWKDVVGYERYLISNKGNVKAFPINSPGTNTKKEHLIKYQISKNGYVFFRLSYKGKSKNESQHRLMAIAFITNPENKPCVNHINGIRNDNRLVNLEWVSYSENSKHGYYNNNRINPLRKLTESQVLEIKKELENYRFGLISLLSKKYNVSFWAISLIKNGKSYINVK